MEEDLKFDLNAIEQTLANYKKNSIYDGVVVAIREDGVIFNIGGKSDAFIEKSEISDFEITKIGDRFKVTILGGKNEDGMILVSKDRAEELIIGSTTAEKLKIGSQFSFYVTGYKNNGLRRSYNAFSPCRLRGHGAFKKRRKAFAP